MPAPAQFNQVPVPEKIREVTRAILERPEFTEPSRWRESLVELLRAIKEWLDRLGSWAEAHPTLAKILFVVSLLLLLACLGHILYLALVDALPFRRKRDAVIGRAARWEILQGAAANWREALDLAQAMIREGNTRRAIWIAHRVLLGLLDQQGAVQFAGWKTNSHYLCECAQSHPWYSTFIELTEIYDQIVYASRNISAEIVESLVLRVDRMCSEAGSGA
ncbi:MAG TPA: hypothetical protein VFX54_16915 [Candidatus Binatia bacterium]|nr:hypothetical protein [Candidatus Binatia bacterium]